MEARHMGEWEIIIDPFADKRQTPLIIKEREYGLHPAVDFDENTSALKCFQSFIPPKLVNSLCEWTNERAGMYFIETYKIERKVHGLLWKDVTVPEMYVFIALMLMMGIIHYPAIVSYFHRSFLCGGPEVFSSQIMSRNKFSSILNFFRFSDPKYVDKSKPLSRVFMFFAEIRDITTTLVDIGDICALDECLLLYKGRLHFKQYIKTKRGRFGLKLFCLCPSDPQFRGYTYNFALYIGKDIYDIAHIPGTEHLTMSERVVVYLLQNMLDEGREVILDNWYLSLRLAEFLLSRNTYTTGTIRIHRGVPKELVDTNLSEHQACFIRKNDVLLVKYKDKRDVYVLTTKLTANFVEKIRHKKDTVQQYYLKPKHIEHYNANMGAVDAIDQALEPYNCARKSYTWFKKLGFHMIHRMVLNANVFYKISHSQIGLHPFTIMLCDEILTKYSKNYTKCANDYKKRNDTPEASHKLMDNIVEGSRRKRNRCWVCYNVEKKN